MSQTDNASYRVDGGIARAVHVTNDRMPSASMAGAASIASGQFTTGASAALLVAARAGRRSISLMNTDETDSIAIGVAGVTVSTGHILPPLGSISIDSTAAIYAVAVGGTPLLTYLESYDA